MICEPKCIEYIKQKNKMAQALISCYIANKNKCIHRTILAVFAGLTDMFMVRVKHDFTWFPKPIPYVFIPSFNKA